MFAEFGTFTGTGAAVNITIGMRVDVVLICSQTNGTLYGKSRTMNAADYLSFSMTATGLITDALGAPTFITDGFTLPAGFCTALTVFHWMAIQSENDAATLSWAGDNTDNRNITGLPFQPDWIFALSTDASQPPRLWHVTKGGDLAGRYEDIGTWATNKIQSARVDGFQVGSDLNVTGKSYVALCFKTNSTSCDIDRYVGLGAVGTRVINLVSSFTPAFVLIMQWGTPTGTVARGPIRFMTNTAGRGMQLQSLGDYNTQVPIAFGAGTFTMDCAGTVWNGLDNEFYYICIPRRLGGALENPPSAGTPRTHARGLGPYAMNPNEYEMAKTIRRLNTQYTNLALGDQ